ncbi:hypothetical protein LWC35_19390 [Pseudonocardia kujensis]|uniref:hypothetical protein n=1 Tax=Pseudonocardia kujensis TaxID=1128675 RepID=UPI001E3C5D12|nr:hypothetical protein [Pseudonocardia kujensis]MCE0765045.1 hypothetical protein [Pseudonocardia kujensis]
MPTPLLPLRGIHCERCGHVATPVQHFGCESCGAHGADVADRPLTGEGTVLGAVTVHRPGGETVRIGSVHLQEGPMVRALLAADVVAEDRVRATETDAGLLFVRGDH